MVGLAEQCMKFIFNHPYLVFTGFLLFIGYKAYVLVKAAVIAVTDPNLVASAALNASRALATTVVETAIVPVAQPIAGVAGATVVAIEPVARPVISVVGATYRNVLNPVFMGAFNIMRPVYGFSMYSLRLG